MTAHFVCSESELNAIDEPGSHGFSIDNQAIFVVKQSGSVFFYRNSCPHLGVELEWVEHQFLDADDSLIQCATHGALFVIDSGECVYGPCMGQKLQMLEHRIENDQVLVELS